MGALHEGHLSLISRSREECDVTIASIFVNPTQFNDPSDFEKYPRMTASDTALLKDVGCDILFLPEVVEMYENPLLSVEPYDIGYLDTILEGAKRPGHYQGVATIVDKLFLAIQPHKVYMGLKDYQQVKVIEKLVRDRGFDIQIIGCPTLRESNGLAMSSRNMRLSSEARDKAGVIYRALRWIAENKFLSSPNAILSEAIRRYILSSSIELEYLELRNASDLSEVPLDCWEENIFYVVLFAGWLEGVRLIDNLEL